MLASGILEGKTNTDSQVIKDKTDTPSIYYFKYQKLSSSANYAAEKNTFQCVACSQPYSGTCIGTGTLASVPNSPFYGAVRKNVPAQACSHDLCTLKLHLLTAHTHKV